MFQKDNNFLLCLQVPLEIPQMEDNDVQPEWVSKLFQDWFGKVPSSIAQIKNTL